MRNFLNHTVNTLILAISGMVFFTACQKQENIKTTKGKPEVELVDFTTDSTGNQSGRRKVVHLRKDTVYLMSKNFERQAGEQLIIDEGTLIKVSAPATGSGPSMTIMPGGLITATGTSAEPIVFTSNARAGTQGPNWGGIIIQGKSFNNSVGTEGIADDFSGVIQFVRVEFASLAMVGVGSQTVIENVMVSYTDAPVYALYQSAFNIYGGTFNTRNLISYACAGPADFLLTNGYSGNMQNLIASRHPYFGHTGANPYNVIAGVFIQNNSNNIPVAPLPYTNPVISNLTVVGPNNQNGSPAAYADTNLLASALVTTNSACFHIRNSLLLGYPAACWILNDNSTAVNIVAGNGELNYSIVHSNDPARCFYLAPGTYDPYNSENFRNYVLGDAFHNQQFLSADQFMFRNILNYDSGPDLMPVSGSPVLQGANFDSSAVYNNIYFKRNENYLGAVGTVDWLKNWTNFIPLKTNYNFPQ